MKVTVYSCRSFDEKELFEAYGNRLGIELVLCPDGPDKENAYLAEGSECIDILTTQMTKELLKVFAGYGVKYVTTRTIGYDHIDIKAAKELIRVITSAVSIWRSARTLYRSPCSATARTARTTSTG